MHNAENTQNQFFDINTVFVWMKHGAKAKQKNYFVSGNAGDEKNLYQDGCKFKLNVLNKVYTQRATLAALLFVENKESYLSLFQGEKKRQFIRINMLVEKRLNDEFN